MTTRVGFYHLTRWPLEQALPLLLEKAVAAGHRAVLRTATPERLDALNTLLWTYRDDSWLPHGTRQDGEPEDHPVYLTLEDERPDDADVLVLTDGADSARRGEFARVLELFDGNAPDAVQRARDHYRTCREAGFDLEYLQQTERGGWDRKA